jgi:hypothetical protein
MSILLVAWTPYLYYWLYRRPYSCLYYWLHGRPIYITGYIDAPIHAYITGCMDALSILLAI